MPTQSGPVSGLLNINKPAGITSHDVVARIRKLAGQRKVGHAGTLDPLATGVLLVCLGQATRLIEYLVAGRKQYRATVQFGTATDTDDAEGEAIATGNPANLSEGQLRDILPTFVGDIQQTPPIFSALKKDGQPLYKRARAGQPVDVSPRAVTIYALTWVDWQPPDLTLDVICSPGTYIRALARDLGQASGVPAHLAALTRTASGDWLLEQAVSLTRLEAEAAEGHDHWQRHLLPPDRAISHLPRVTLTEAAVTQVKYGQQVQISDIRAGPDEAVSDTLVRAYTPAGEFLAILTQANADDKLWQPKKVFQTR